MSIDHLRYARLKDRALVAELSLRLQAAQVYGLVRGGPAVDTDACELAIAEAKAAGVTYGEDEIEAVIRRELAA